jgi:hypothetical protein
MAIYLLDNSLKVNIFFEEFDSGFDDNICISFCEDCPEEERVFRADETNLYLTKDEATQFAIALLQAIAESTD